MTSFLTHRALVHDGSLPTHRRHAALRTCLTRFAPYGLRATYHHLTLSARIPSDLDADPDALVRAVEELHEARLLWLEQAERYAARRRAEKRAGQRAPTGPAPWWRSPWWRSPTVVWAHDPLVHPPLRLPEYVRRQGAREDGAALPGCPSCGSDGQPVPVLTGHGRAELCRCCGRVLCPCPCGRWHRFVPAVAVPWSRLWQREHMTSASTPTPHWPGPTVARIEQLMAIDPPWLPFPETDRA
ncbi:hypothetical protein ACWDRR_30525 [Kitasatospora sp. NPDC003701]